MGSSCVLPLVALLLLCGSGLTLGGNILVIPYSHWINMRVIVDELVARNHSVTVLTHSATPSIKFSQKENFKTIIFKISMEEEETRALWLMFFNIWMNEGTSVLQTALMFWNMWSDMERFGMAICDGMLLNEDLIASLKASNFDAVLFDPVMVCSDLLAEILDLPRILSYRLMFAHTNERLCGQLPVPPSYVPAGASQGHLSDKMNFMERVENMLLYIVQTTFVQLQGILLIDNFYTKITGTLFLLMVI
uniref:Uncharacterized protein n=1 Tax=Astyanax mexicanus TaxID=7994 RepID=A0A8B9K5Q1_ASTMX